MSPLSVISLHPVKKSSDLNQERNMHRPNTIYKPKQFSNILGDFDLKGKQMYFFTGESVVMD